jgi:hypothetical protein
MDHIMRTYQDATLKGQYQWTAGDVDGKYVARVGPTVLMIQKAAANHYILDARDSEENQIVHMEEGDSGVLHRMWHFVDNEASGHTDRLEALLVEIQNASRSPA